MSAGTPCVQTPINMVPMTGNCDPHFTWLKKISIDGEPLVDLMLQPVGSVQLFTKADDAQTWLLSWLVCGLLLTGAMVARMGLTKAKGMGGTLQFVPDDSLTVRNGFELVTGALFDLCEDLLGRANAKKFF